MHARDEIYVNLFRIISYIFLKKGYQLNTLFTKTGYGWIDMKKSSRLFI